MFQKKKDKFLNVTIRSTDTLIKDIDRVASKENCTRSEAIRGLVKLGLVHYGNQK
jgi:metal-responsive CopG/Arc/MetJ family transcriptional regulator